MKKNLVSFALLALLVGLLSMTSCKKENTLGNGTQFRATMEGCTSQDGKTVLNGTALEWVGGDQIAVYGITGAGIYSATPQTPATTAVFDNVSGETGNAPFRAFYPTSLTTDGVNITLPATQSYVEGSINEFPMYAESSDNQLAFKNLCGVLKLHLTKTGVNISSITITTASEINGTFSVSYNSGDPELTYSANGTTITTLTCATPQSIAEGKDFYIYLPEGSYSGLQIEMYTDDARYCIKHSNTTINVTRSQYTLITLGETLVFRPVGSKGGLFPVSATQQVWFSQGNLQYQASTGIWRFAENQYDTIGHDNSNISATYNGWIDLFGWGTASNPTISSTNNSDYSTFVDWGTNAISNGGSIENSGWRTLSLNEWMYLINHVTKATGNIEGVNGVILLPTNWTLPNDCTFNSGMNGWMRNTYTISQWSKMESNGAIFLPVAGYRENTYVGNVNVWGDIWTSTMLNSTMARSINFGSTRISEDAPDHHRYYGFSVRLVRNN